MTSLMWESVKSGRKYWLRTAPLRESVRSSKKHQFFDAFPLKLAAVDMWKREKDFFQEEQKATGTPCKVQVLGSLHYWAIKNERN